MHSVGELVPDTGSSVGMDMPLNHWNEIGLDRYQIRAGLQLLSCCKNRSSHVGYDEQSDPNHENVCPVNDRGRFLKPDCQVER